MYMNKKAINNRENIEAIRTKLVTGAISYETAKMLAKPIIADINSDIVAISKKHNKRPYKVSFAGLMR